MRLSCLGVLVADERPSRAGGDLTSVALLELTSEVEQPLLNLGRQEGERAEVRRF